MKAPIKRSFSFEFFPPRTDEGAIKLRAVREQLAAVRPEFFSVTFGAGGSTREGTWNTVLEIAQAGAPVAPHISCIGTTHESVRELINGYKSRGIRRLVALRGDLPSGAAGGTGDFAYASELVSFIRRETGDWFHIEVAAYPEFHPQARSAQDDLQAFARKVHAGADSAITQFFYNPDAYSRFVADVGKLGVAVPVVPGVMPLTNYTQIKRFCEKSAIELPRWIEERLRSYGDDVASIKAFGLDVVTDLCKKLLAAGAPGLHFYTMNQAGPTLDLWRRLNLSGR
jgi:methylenetetrahydrofolate reductase (NADPH)